MSRNGSITSFFKPVIQPSQPTLSPQSPVARRQDSSTPGSTPRRPPPSPSSLPALHCSSSPPAPASAVRDRNAEIRGSDDEDDDDLGSDEDDFPSLFPLQPAKADAGLCATPQAKRRALAFPDSPLTINTKPKFDIKALLKHAEADNAIQEREQRAAALLAEGSPTARNPRTADGAPTSLHQTMLGVLSDPDDSQDEGNSGRLWRAVERTEAGVQRREWQFFHRQSDPSSTAIEVRPAFPKAKATGVWALLAPERYRSEAFEDGLPYQVQCKMQNLPDEIFLWVLHEATREKSRRLRDEYLRLLGACPDQVGRLMDENCVLGLFRALGASQSALAPASQPSATSGTGAPHPEHDRTRLQAVLRILAETAHALRFPSLTRTVSILLRLGIDNIVREDYDVMTDYQDTLCHAVLAVPLASWDQFCGIVGDSLYFHTQHATLRWNAVSAIPLLHPRSIELRRRLALVFIFDDPLRASAPPDATFSLRAVIDRLDQADEFIVDRNSTDYFELLALSEMLNVAVGDGAPPARDASPAAVKQFNEDVDELAHRIKFMWSNIHEQGAAYMSRLEARVQLRDFERKLQHVVRTRPRPKEDIFGICAREDEDERPKQQQFMKRFLSKNLPPPVTPAKGG